MHSLQHEKTRPEFAKVGLAFANISKCRAPTRRTVTARSCERFKNRPKIEIWACWNRRQKPRPRTRPGGLGDDVVAPHVVIFGVFGINSQFPRERRLRNTKLYLLTAYNLHELFKGAVPGIPNAAPRGKEGGYLQWRKKNRRGYSASNRAVQKPNRSCHRLTHRCGKFHTSSGLAAAHGNSRLRTEV